MPHSTFIPRHSAAYTGPHQSIHQSTQYQPSLAQLQLAQAQAQAQAQIQAQAQLQLSLQLQSLNSKIIQAQQLALTQGTSVDDVLSRMGGLNEAEVGLLRLCVVREQEERVKLGQGGQFKQQSPLQSILPRPQAQSQLPLRTVTPPQTDLTQSNLSPAEQRTAARLRVEQNLRARWEKEASLVPCQTGLEEGFNGLNLAGKGRVGVQGQGNMMTPPLGGKADLPLQGGLAARRNGHNLQSLDSRALASPPSTTTPQFPTFTSTSSGQATPTSTANVSWRNIPSARSQPPSSPAPSPIAFKLNSSTENAAKGFNGVFGNKVSTATPTASRFNFNKKEEFEVTRRREERAGSGSSGSSGYSGYGHGRREDNLTYGSDNTSHTSLSTAATTPMSEGEIGNGYFGMGKGLQPHTYGFGRDESYPLCKVLSKGSNGSGRAGPPAVGVIGQGYAPVIPQVQVQLVGGVSVVIRQPNGPPGGAEEFRGKNFASRIRQKAVSDLSVLGRRVAQHSPTRTTL